VSRLLQLKPYRRIELNVSSIRPIESICLVNQFELIIPSSLLEMSRCFHWRCAPVFGIIITNFTLSNNTFNLFTIYLSILQCTSYNHIARVFPPLLLLDTHNRLFCRPSEAYNSVNPGSFSKWRPTKDVKYRRRTRVQISASEAFTKKFRYAFS